MLGWFSTDPLKKTFSKLQQGSGGTYFVNAKYVIEKIHIQHTKLTLKLEIAVGGIDGHTCDICCRDILLMKKNCWIICMILKAQLISQH